MPDCSSIQKSLAWCQGRQQFAGMRRRLYFIDKKNIMLWPKLPRDSNGRPLGAAYNGVFVLATDTEWQYIDILLERSQLTSDPQGEYPAQMQLNKLVAVHPGVGEEATEFAALVNAADCVFIVEDMQGNLRVVGHEHYPVKVTVAQDEGQWAGSAPSTIITVEAADDVPAPVYGGIFVVEGREIVMTPAATTPSSFTQL